MARRRHFVREQRHAAAARRLILLACGLVMRAARDAALRPRRKLRHRGSRPSGARHLARIGRLPPSVRPRDGSSSARRGKEREALGAVAVGQLHAEPPAHPRHGGEEDERGEHERDDADRDGDVRRAVCRRVWREGQERRGRGGRRRVERRPACEARDEAEFQACAIAARAAFGSGGAAESTSAVRAKAVRTRSMARIHGTPGWKLSVLAGSERVCFGRRRALSTHKSVRPSAPHPR
eukprot:CAMPEP_0205896308 /NCGR_PEP_ID=MMETSP1083-20121108/24886_1 /ASSEMBLY_ACC=CAM_ASM_000430 /TAXON_ID=97485 /ORGANISM="Prymnesium parvum, Strain Texoma1" /LENGTH=236 /DNA_ID=CAMNT_0053261375 /DNA_START=416 /DNA_END=1123 /DNA_ORIENTATION=-